MSHLPEVRGLCPLPILPALHRHPRTVRWTARTPESGERAARGRIPAQEKLIMRDVRVDLIEVRWALSMQSPRGGPSGTARSSSGGLASRDETGRLSRPRRTPRVERSPRLRRAAPLPTRVEGGGAGRLPL